jgi:aldehyde dehydrogenase (NAD+)
VEAIKEAAVELRLDSALASDSFASIISEGHYKRLRGLMTRSLGNVVVGGNTDDEKGRITPTVYRDVKEGDSLLEGYIVHPSVLFTGSSPLAKFSVLFCPLSPWTTFGRRSSTLMPSGSYPRHYCNVFSFCISPHPLVLYAFTEDAEIKQARTLPFLTCSRPPRSYLHWPVRDETRSGGLHFNDVVQPLSVDALPFSGIGESGCTWLPVVRRVGVVWQLTIG